jgi:hypothetical protein
VLAAACGDATPVTVRYQPPEGAVYRYAMDQQMSIRSEEQGGDIGGVTVHVAFTQTVRGPAEGGTAVEVRVDSVAVSGPQVEQGAMTAAMQMLRGLTSRIVFDERMQVLSSEISEGAGVPPQMAAQIANGLRGSAFPLPAHPVRRGESWTADLAPPSGQIPGLTKPLTLHYRLTLKDVRVRGADTVVQLGIETTFPRDPIPFEMGGASATMRIEGMLEGNQEYSITRGAIVRVGLKGTVRITTSGSALGDGTMAMDQQLDLALLEGAGTP